MFPKHWLTFVSYVHCELCNRPYFLLCFVSKKSLARIGLGVSILLTAFYWLYFSPPTLNFSLTRLPHLPKNVMHELL